LLVIRLARTGKKKQAYFRVVVAEKERAVGAKFIEILGNYNPHEKKLEIDKERLEKYLSNGAQPSNTLAIILKKEKIEMPKWVKIKERNRPPKKAEEEKKEEAAPAEEKTESETKEAVTEEVAETPVEKESEKEPEKAEEAPAEEVKEEKTEESK
jgi:small subunit ribosomal protein S16